MAATLPPMLQFQPLIAGIPLPGGKVYFLKAGTTTPQAAYAADGTTPLANPLTLDSNGIAEFRLGSGLTYKIDLKDSGGAPVAGWPIDQIDAGDTSVLALRSDLANTTDPSKGAAMVGYKYPGTGSIAQTVFSKLNETVNVLDFGAKFDGITDDSDAIQAALDYAFSVKLGTMTDPFGVRNIGAVTVKFPAGKTITSKTLETYQGVRIIGDGILSTIIQSSVDGYILRNKMPGDQYGPSGVCIEKLTIIGDTTKTNQIGIGLLRAYRARLQDLNVQECGAHGMTLYQCVNSFFDNVDIQLNKGYGLVLDEGFNSWTDLTKTGYPSIGNVFINVHVGFNENIGIVLQGITESNIFYGGGSEQNNRQTDGVGYQISISGAMIGGVANEFNDFYSETTKGASLIYVNYDNTGNTVRFSNYHFYPNGNVMSLLRCAIVNKGTLVMNNPIGSGSQFPAISGSKAPFRVTKATGTIYLTNPMGCTITDGIWVEDETSAVTGLQSNVFFTSRRYIYGRTLHRAGFGDNTVDWQVDTEAYPWLSLQSFYKGIAFGSGATAIDTYLQRTGARTLGMGTVGGSQFFDAGAAWNGNHLLLGAYHVWVDNSGRLRIKSGAPTSDVDGTVVGTQS